MPILVENYLCRWPAKTKNARYKYLSLVLCPNCLSERAIEKTAALRSKSNGLCRKCKDIINPPVKLGSKRPIDVMAKVGATKRSSGRFVGSKNPNWNPNLTEEERLLRKNRHMHNPEHKDWSFAVKIRDGFMCQLTKLKGKIVSHHLNSFDIYPEERFLVNNGVTLLAVLHRVFHSIYGSGANTKAQYDEFKAIYFTGTY